ncbi:hypothetical protein ACFOD9_12055 [Novosphingobium bradum]|uniref:Uncharacterized protein n=1 Tax=Novosphingobium bradum TaxID=1737444 RepID=A0ABV7IW83_9SPHN
MHRAAFLALLLLVPALAGCGGADTGPVRSAGAPVVRPPAPRTQPRAPVRRPIAPPPVQALPGLEGVTGASGADLVRQFGNPRLDVLEGDARKLQFGGSACVLDIYLYPAAPGREPQASYVDARRASDGQDVDRVACVRSMRRVPPPPQAAAPAPAVPARPPHGRVTRP